MSEELSETGNFLKNEENIKVFKMVSGEEVIARLSDEDADTYELTEPVLFTLVDTGDPKTPQQVRPWCWPMNSYLGRYRIDKADITLATQARSEAINIYHQFVIGELNYVSGANADMEISEPEVEVVE